MHAHRHPVNWKHGEDVIIAGSVSDDDARKIYAQGWKAPRPYLRIVPQSNGADARSGARHGETCLRRTRTSVELLRRNLNMRSAGPVDIPAAKRQQNASIEGVQALLLVASAPCLPGQYSSQRWTDGVRSAVRYKIVVSSPLRSGAASNRAAARAMDQRRSPQTSRVAPDGPEDT